MAASQAVVVTGSAGLIGSAVCASFVNDGWQVVGFDRPPIDPQEGVIAVSCDVTSDESVRAAVERTTDVLHRRVASVIHLAAYYDFSGEASTLYEEVTVRGTRRLLGALAPLRPEQFLFSGDHADSESRGEGGRLGAGPDSRRGGTLHQALDD
jgi:UDP-glucose 4-epimerase